MKIIELKEITLEPGVNSNDATSYPGDGSYYVTQEDNYPVVTFLRKGLIWTVHGEYVNFVKTSEIKEPEKLNPDLVTIDGAVKIINACMKNNDYRSDKHL